MNYELYFLLITRQLTLKYMLPSKKKNTKTKLKYETHFKPASAAINITAWSPNYFTETKICRILRILSHPQSAKTINLHLGYQRFSQVKIFNLPAYQVLLFFGVISYYINIKINTQSPLSIIIHEQKRQQTTVTVIFFIQ